MSLSREDIDIEKPLTSSILAVKFFDIIQLLSYLQHTYTVIL